MEAEHLHSEYNSNDMEMEFTKSKKIKLSNNAHTFLHLHILEVESINLHPSIVNKACCVVSWLHPGEECETDIFDGFPSPDWDTKRMFYIGQRPYYNHKFLYLEVLRFTSENEPGTSNGKVIMGIAKITLPKEFDSEITERFDLVKHNYEERKNEVVGSVILSMKLEEV